MSLRYSEFALKNLCMRYLQEIITYFCYLSIYLSSIYFCSKNQEYAIIYVCLKHQKTYNSTLPMIILFTFTVIGSNCALLLSILLF